MSRPTAIRLPLPVIRAVEAVYAKVPSAHCKGLCVPCCAPIGPVVPLFERDRIAARTGKNMNTTASKTGLPLEGERCNMLTAAGTCSVYDIRPMICRIFGVAADLACPFGCDGNGSLTAAEGRELYEELLAAVEPYQE